MKKMKNLMAIIFILAVMCLLSGCSGNEVFNEEQLLADIVDQDYMQTRMGTGVKYYDLSIEKRLTSEDDKRDQVWVKFMADTETDSAEVEALMTYTLYNEGWMLDSIQLQSVVYEPLVGPLQQIADDELYSQYDYYQYQYENVDLSSGIAYIYYKTQTVYKYMVENDIVCIEVSYSSLASCPNWSITNQTVVENQEYWGLGSWRVGNYYPGGTYYSIDVKSFDGKTFEATIQKSVQANGGRKYYDVSGEYAVTDYGDGEYSVYIDEYDVTFGIYRKKGISYGGNEGTQTESVTVNSKFFDDGVDIFEGKRY